MDDLLKEADKRMYYIMDQDNDNVAVTTCVNYHEVTDLEISEHQLE